VHLQLTPINYAPIFFFTLRGARAPSAPPGYAYICESVVTFISFEQTNLF